MLTLATLLAERDAARRILAEALGLSPDLPLVLLADEAAQAIARLRAAQTKE
jgi:hypothetical protein